MCPNDTLCTRACMWFGGACCLLCRYVGASCLSYSTFRFFFFCARRGASGEVWYLHKCPTNYRVFLFFCVCAAFQQRSRLFFREVRAAGRRGRGADGPTALSFDTVNMYVVQEAVTTREADGGYQLYQRSPSSCPSQKQASAG